jgi:25S rRNA (uracil2843-N3)-methyltransferase
MSKRRAHAKPKAAARVAFTAKGGQSGSAQDLNRDFGVQDMQRVLNLVSTTYLNPAQSDQESLSQRIQSVKSRLFDRDFEGAFLDASEDEREAYVVRWSAARALGYVGILADTFKLLHSSSDSSDGVVDGISNMTIDDTDANPAAETSILCVGGGAGAELLAIGFILSKMIPQLRCKLEILDIAPWDVALGKLYNGMTTPLPLSKYAADHVRAQNKALVDPARLSYAFSQKDILNMTPDNAKEVANVRLVTFFFTLNELFTASLNQTRKCLQLLTSTLSPGSLFLVVDSAGSYSHVQLGKETEEKRNYPMIWLLDLIMTPATKGDGVGEWEKINSSESTWFRIPNGLKYPVELENMRYQLHLYRKLEQKTEP